MNNTFNEINSLAEIFNEGLNDSIFCSMVDRGIDPGIAWNAVHTGVMPVAISDDIAQPTDEDPFEAVEFASL
jgi:hypothetical protein